MINVEDFIVPVDSSIQELFDVLSRTVSGSFGSGFAVIVDQSASILGIVSDSDVRKFIQKSGRAPVSIAEVVRKDFLSVEANQDGEAAIETLLDPLKERGWLTDLPVRLVPVLSGRRPIGILELDPDDPVLKSARDRVIVVGLGYVGLPLAAALARRGREVWGLERNKNVLQRIRHGEDVTKEPGVATSVKKHLGKNLFLIDDLLSLPNSNSGQRDAFIITVGTPLGDDRNIDTEPLQAALKEISPLLNRGSSIFLRSTVPAGTSQSVAKRIEKDRGWTVGRDFFMAATPERTVEGNALEEIFSLPQLVGGVTPACSSRASDFFEQVSSNVVVMENSEAAELGKLASNAYRDYQFSFANHLAGIARQHNVDINRLIDQSNSGYARNSIPQPSPGVGGPCLSKDSWILEQGLPETNMSPVSIARQRNMRVPGEVSKVLISELEKLKAQSVLCLGLAFKGVPPTPDLRNSTGLEIAEMLSKAGFAVSGWDSEADLATLEFIVDENSSPDAVLILNNHPSNTKKMLSLVSPADSPPKLIFDPWRLASEAVAEWSHSARSSIVYLSMSHQIVIGPKE